MVAGLVSLPAFPHYHHQGEHSSAALATSPNAADKQEQGQLTCTHTTRASSTILLRWGSGPALLSAVVGKGQGQLSHSRGLQTCSPTCHRWQGGASFPHPDTTWQLREMGSALLFSHPQGWFTFIPANTVNSTMMPRWGTGPILLCAAASEGQGQLFHSFDLQAGSLTCQKW